MDEVIEETFVAKSKNSSLKGDAATKITKTSKPISSAQREKEKKQKMEREKLFDIYKYQNQAISKKFMTPKNLRGADK